MSTHYDIVTKYVYEKDGIAKTIYKPTGVLKQIDNGLMFIRMNHQPDIEHLVFKQKKKEPIIQID